MSKHDLRKDMTCLNCSHVVEKRYCPNCGQENTDTRKTFHHLFVHFFEDLTHYENAFWKTIVNLLFKPGALTKEYLSGKRMSYLAPVRLYIFISFVTFLLMGLLPHKEESAVGGKRKNHTAINFTGANSPEAQAIRDSLQKESAEGGLQIGDYRSVRQFDSLQNTLPEAKRASGMSRFLQRRLALVNEKNTPEEFREKFTEAFVHNLPKALFLYMPFFALFLWLFHGKKRWYYFDHGIFTLHYFSFLLATLCVYLLLNSVTSYLGAWLNDAVGFLALAMMIWWFFYFFRSHSNFYGEPKSISRLKSASLFVINVFFVTVFVVALILFTALYLH